MFCNRCGNPIEKDSSFCSRCGNQVAYSKGMKNNSNLFSQKFSDKLGILIGVGIGLGVVLVIGIVCRFFVFKQKYYFSDSSYESTVESTSNSSSSKSTKGKYQTGIIYDNKYSGVSISSKTDAISLIMEDSVNQKDSCPSEILSVENAIIEQYDITAVNLCEMEVGFARELGNVIGKIYNDYPAVRGYLTNMTLVNVPLTGEYIAAFMPIFTFASADTQTGYPWVLKTQILLNSSYFLNKGRLESSVHDGSSSGHFPPNSTIYSPVAHELGHYLSFLAMMKYYQMDSILLIDSSSVNTLYALYDDFAKGDYSLKMITEAYDNYIRDTGSTISLDDWRATISNYAVTRDNSGEYIYDETVAESFHDVYLNGENAREASKYVVAVLKEKLGS